MTDTATETVEPTTETAPEAPAFTREELANSEQGPLAAMLIDTINSEATQLKSLQAEYDAGVVDDSNRDSVVKNLVEASEDPQVVQYREDIARLSEALSEYVLTNLVKPLPEEDAKALTEKIENLRKRIKTGRDLGKTLHPRFEELMPQIPGVRRASSSGSSSDGDGRGAGTPKPRISNAAVNNKVLGKPTFTEVVKALRSMGGEANKDIKTADVQQAAFAAFGTTDLSIVKGQTKQFQVNGVNVTITV